MPHDRNGFPLQNGDKVLLIATIDNLSPETEKACNCRFTLTVPDGIDENYQPVFVGNTRLGSKIAIPSPTEIPILGLDFGGVISEQNTATEVIPDVVEQLKRVRDRFKEVYIISRVDSLESANRVKFYMDHRKLWDLLNIKPENIHFCLFKSDKGPIARRLGITHFVDDHTEVLSNMTSVEHRYAFRTKAQELAEYPATNMIYCKTWQEISNHILSTF